MKFNIVFLYIIVYLTIGFPKTSALLPWKDSPKDDSICQTSFSKLTSYTVPYVETYWDSHPILKFYKKIKSRINYKTEYHVTHHINQTCCVRYEEISNRCTPICSPDCQNGTCVAPDICVCHPGYEKSTEEKNICRPICSNGCLNGDCVQPEVCNCLPDYWLDSDGYTCRPTCEDGCDLKGGFCFTPHTCICPDKYEKSIETGSCEPICNSDCINGRCTFPNVCSCKDGYEPDEIDYFVCKPTCEIGCPLGSECTAHNVCTCKEGYKRSNDEDACEPICSQECVGGFCVLPEICACHPGYGFLDNSMYTCVPICESGCVNGTCIRPNTCKCDEGFILDNRFFMLDRCIPVCTPSCDPNAECTAPDRCTCLTGYRFVHENDRTNDVLDSKNTTCVPACEEDCGNGTCSFPNHCICETGYVMTAMFNAEDEKYINYCQAICNKNCGPNGYCATPNSCVCYEGYSNETTRDDWNVCLPICEPDCEHGTCTAPNICTCDMGYERDESGRCVAICNPSCIQGTCIEPNVCTCDEGFVLRNETICEPICESACTNGTCVAPNTCHCNEGFLERRTDNISACFSTCSRNCSGHGICLDEWKSCLCFFGWTGWDCDEARVCVYKTTLNSTHLLSSVTVINETNSTLMESYDNAPLCYQCSDSLDNETLCVAIQSDESLTIPTVGCFLSTELPCYRRPQHNALKRSTGVTESLIGVTIAIIIIAAVAGYTIVHKRRKQGTIPVNVQASSLHAAGTEALIEGDEVRL